MKDSINPDFIKELTDADPDLLPQLFQMFSQSSKEKLDELKKNLEGQDFAALRKTAHALRSSSLNLGAVALPMVLQEIEGFKEGEENLLPAKVQLTELELRRLKIELAKIIAQ